MGPKPLEFIDRTEPDSPGSKTPTPGYSNGEERVDRSASELRVVGATVYREVWDEFYAWEPGYCANVLRALGEDLLPPGVGKRKGKPHPRKETARKFVRERYEAPVGMVDAGDGGEPTMSGQVVVTRFDAYGRGVTSRVTMPIITVDATVTSHPAYESCTPTSKSIRVSETREDTLAFLPYADNPSFPSEEHLAKFKNIEWDENFDPDLEMIQLETARRLHISHDVALVDIDRMKMLRPLRVSHNTGLLWESLQRDFLHWPGTFQVRLKTDLLTSCAPQADDLQGRLISILKTFCPNLNCLVPLCITHTGLRSSYLPSRKPHVTPERMSLSEGDPCGPECFRLIPDIEKFADTLPPSPTDSDHGSSLQELYLVLNIMPDMYPCQLAGLCFRPCREIFIQQIHLFDNQLIIPSADQDSTIESSTDGEGGQSQTDSTTSLNSIQRRKRRKKERTKLEFKDDPSHVHCDLVKPCVHPGPCSTSQCQCWVNKLHCSLACRCGISCLRQWPPCSCRHCDLDSCPCAQGKRECIPGRCIKCDAAYNFEAHSNYFISKIGSTKRPCVNTRMQRQDSKPVEIKSGCYGLGAFAVQDMNAKEYIGTYTGEILTSEAAELTDNITKHNSLNYLFEFSHENPNTEMFDAAYAGNATRFLNHGDNGKDNVEAFTMLVNGEHQIGFFTKKKIKAGTELLLDYGEKYWENQHV